MNSTQKISDTSGNFNDSLNAGDQFSSAIANIGDLEFDGVTDLAVGPLTMMITGRTGARYGFCLWTATDSWIWRSALPWTMMAALIAVLCEYCS